MYEFLKNRLSVQQKRAARYYLYRILFPRDLTRLAIAYGSDKAEEHHYTRHYQAHFEPLRRRRLNLLEIGVGGYQNPWEGGESLRMWKVFFPNSRIYGIDFYEKSYHNEDRIQTFQGSQEDESFLRRVAQEIGPIDIVIDDGSHYNQHVIASFKTLFPLMNETGIYVIEDLQTSYWDEIDGHPWDGSSDLAAPDTSMNFIKRLTDGINYQEFKLENYKPSYFDKNITSIHFYHNLVFIYKGINAEGSNILSSRPS